VKLARAEAAVPSGAGSLKGIRGIAAGTGAGHARIAADAPDPNGSNGLISSDNSLDYLNYLTTRMEYFNHRKCTPQWVILQPDVTPFIDVTYVVKGQALYRINGREHAVKAGDLLCVPQGSRRTARAVPDDLMECYTMNFQLYDSRDGSDVPLPLALITPIGQAPHVARLFEEMSHTWLMREAGYRLKTNGYALIILAELLGMVNDPRHVANMDARVRRAVDHITAHFNESVCLTDLAALARLNPTYFSKLFRESMGVSVNQYVQAIRVNHAEMLLAEGNHSVTEVAKLCGFCDVFYFSRVFKQQKGVSPSVVIKKDR